MARRRRPSARAAPAVSPVAPPITPNRPTAVVAALTVLAALAAGLYLPALAAPLVYDDRRSVVENPTLAEPVNLVAALLWDRFRPLANLSFVLDRAVWGAGPRGFHATNLLLHVLTAWLVFAFASRARSDDDAAGGEAAPTAFGFAVAAVFAAHPLATQAVVYVSARAELLAAALALATVLAGRAAIVSGRRSLAAVALGLGLLAVAAKETGAIAAPLLALWDHLLLRRHGDPGRRWRRVHAPLLALLAVAGSLRLLAHRLVEGVDPPRPLVIHWLSEAEVTWRYLRLLVWPSGQSLVQPVQRASGPGDLGAWLAVAGLAAVVALVAVGRRRLPRVALGAGWLALALAPSAVVPLNELMAEHRAYLASGGFALAAVTLLAAAVGRLEPRLRRRLSAVGTVALIALLGSATAVRLRVWRDPVTLWRDAAVKAPRTWAPHVFLAQELRARGDLEGAIAAYRRAAAIEPEHGATRLNLGTALAMAGRLEEALPELETAVALAPGSAVAWLNLGRVAGLTGRRPRAHEAFKRAAVASAGDVATRFQLVAVSREQGEEGLASDLCAELARDAAGDPRLAACTRKSSQGASN